ncbi:Lysine-specific demethylase JMJ25 [Bienertia sinuspersici]
MGEKAENGGLAEFKLEDSLGRNDDNDISHHEEEVREENMEGENALKGEVKEEENNEGGNGSGEEIAVKVEEEKDEKVVELPKKRGRKKKQKGEEASAQKNPEKVDQNEGKRSEESKKDDDLNGNNEGIVTGKRQRSCRSKVRYVDEDDEVLQYFEEDEREMKRRKGGRRKVTAKKAVEKSAEVEEQGEEEESKQKRGKKIRVEDCSPSVCENGAEKKDDEGTSERSKRPCSVKKAEENRQKPDYAYDENGIKIDSDMCHQCQRNDKGRVVRCTKCKTKRFCIPCIGNWCVSTNDRGADCSSLPSLPWELQLQVMSADGCNYQKSEGRQRMESKYGGRKDRPHQDYVEDCFALFEAVQ